MLAAASHLFVGLIGAVLLYVALFLRETEEGKLQNRLEKLWIDIDDLSKAALNRQTAFLQQISVMVNSALNRLFGVRFLSTAAVSASLCFSIGTVSLFIAYLQAKRINDFHAGRGAIAFLIVGITSFLVGLSPIPFRYLGFLSIPGSVFFLIYVDQPQLGLNWKNWIDEFLPLLIILGGGFLSDVLFIAVSRWCLRKTSTLMNGWKIVVLLTLNGCLGLALVVGPVLYLAVLELRGRSNSTTDVGIGCMGVSNLVAGAISLLFILLALTALLHLLVWPILERPVYSLQRCGLVRQPKMLAAASVTCLVFAWPHSPIIQVITKLIHG